MNGTLIMYTPPEYDENDPSIPTWEEPESFTQLNADKRTLWESVTSYGTTEVLITESDIQALRDSKVLYLNVQSEYDVFIKLSLKDSLDTDNPKGNE